VTDSATEGKKPVSDAKRAAARKGALALHASGKAHRFTSEEAAMAGSKGGHASKQKRDMHELGRKGGLARAAKRKTRPKNRP
jgi:hypothetical protein